MHFSYLCSLLFSGPAPAALADAGFEVAATAVVPPNLPVGVGRNVSRGACVAFIVPLSSHLWKQRLEQVALASLLSLTAGAPQRAMRHACIHARYSRSLTCGADLQGTCDRPNELSCCCGISACWDPIPPPRSLPSPKTATFHADFLSMWDGVY